MWEEGFTLLFNLGWLNIHRASLKKTGNSINDEKQWKVIILAATKLIILGENFPLSKYMFPWRNEKVMGKLLKESRKQRAEIVDEKIYIPITQMEGLTSNSLKSRQLK